MKSQYQRDVEELFSPREHLKAGYEFSEFEEVILSLQKENPEKPIRCLTEWVWLDLRCNTELINLYMQENIQPVILAAERIIFDSEDPSAIGYRLPRTSPLIAYQSPGLFETKNRYYLMVGPGTKKIISHDVAASLI